MPNNVTTTNCRNHRDIQLLSQRNKLLFTFCQTNAITHIDNWALGHLYLLYQLFNLLIYQGMFHWVDDFCCWVELLELCFVDHSSLHIQGDIQPHRTGTTIEGNGNRLVQFILNIQWIVNRLGIFCDRSHNGYDVCFLITQLTQFQIGICMLIGRSFYLS